MFKRIQTGLFAAMLLLLIGIHTTLDAHAQLSPTNDQTLAVSGRSTEQVKPDTVVVWFAVETKNKTAEGALDSNSAIAQNVISALEKAGANQSELSTSSFNIQPIYNNKQYGPPEGNLTGYMVTNTIQVSGTNLNSTSGWIDTAVKAGATRVNNVRFSISDATMKTIQDGLIKAAIADAREKADLAASATGMKVIGVKSMNLNTGFFGYQGPYGAPMMEEQMGAARVTSGPAVPIIGGEQQVSANVGITYLIGPQY
ncbi:MAG: SIMPL domain-containing protein [Thaumarchaeota archaeon]|nr:SIMPL domain-containing protein [Nitrososphaerota archaeon]